MTHGNRINFPPYSPSEDGPRDNVRASFDPQVERSVPSAPVEGSTFTNSFLRKVKSSSNKRSGSFKSPGSSKISEPTSPRSKQDATAMAMLSPVLSRVREQHRQAELQQLAGACLNSCRLSFLVTKALGFWNESMILSLQDIQYFKQWDNNYHPSRKLAKHRAYNHLIWQKNVSPGKARSKHVGQLS